MSERRKQAIFEWTVYCARFGLVPKNLVGFRYPGLEDHPMTPEMAEEIAHILGHKSANCASDAQDGVPQQPSGVGSGGAQSPLPDA